uniref:Protein Flattop n=1 Tax=Pelusios castaneus TaxID=367368 RepID=A0A8C8SNU5_9SAUR
MGHPRLFDWRPEASVGPGFPDYLQWGRGILPLFNGLPSLSLLQYEDAFTARNLQNWTLPKLSQERPSAREGYTQFIANDRGHLLPSVPRSKTSPWGTFMGTWEMPLKIPPVKLNLTSRSAAAASRLTDWIHKSTALTGACNGLRPQITGKVGSPVHGGCTFIQEACGTSPMFAEAWNPNTWPWRQLMLGMLPRAGLP